MLSQSPKMPEAEPSRALSNCKEEGKMLSQSPKMPEAEPSRALSNCKEEGKMLSHFSGGKQFSRHTSIRTVVAVLAIGGLLLTACAPRTPRTVPVEVEVTREVEVEVPVDVEVTREVEVEVPVEVEVTAIPSEPLPDVTLRAAHYATWDTFNPLIGFGGNMVDTKFRVFSALVALDLNYKVFGDLAESWEVSDDSTVYTFHLREGVKWHDGEPFTAEDVVFTFSLASDPTSGSNRTSALESILGAQESVAGEADTLEGVRAIDDLTVEIELTEPNSYFLVSLAQSIFMVPEHVLGSMAPEDIPSSDFSLNSPVGTGPYRLVDFDSVNQVVTYHAYSDYHWGEPKISRVEWVHIPQPDSQIVAFANGEIDYAPWHIWNEGHFKQAIAVPSLQNLPRTWANIGGLAINVSQPYFQDPRVRQAIFHAIDRRQFLSDTGYNRVYNGYFDLAAWAKNPDVDFVELYPYDPERARELLAEAGWDPNQEVILYATVTGIDDTRLAVQQMLGDVGIKVQIEQVEVATTDKAIYKDEPPTFDLYMHGISLDDPGLGVASSLGCDSALNGFGYCNPELDALFDQDRAATTVEERVEILQQIEALMADEPMLVPLTYSPQYVGFSNEFNIQRYSWYTFPYMQDWKPKQ